MPSPGWDSLVLQASVATRRRKRRRRQRRMLWLLTVVTTAVLAVIAVFIMHISKVPTMQARRAVRGDADGQPRERLRRRTGPSRPSTTGTR